MRFANKTVYLTAGLVALSLVMGMSAGAFMLADGGPSQAVRIALALAPFTVIPLVIGWLAPDFWWMGGIGAFLPLLVGVTLLVRWPPDSTGELLARLPILLPMPLALAFAFLGRLLRVRGRKKPLAPHGS